MATNTRVNRPDSREPTLTTIDVLRTGTVDVDRALAFRESTYHPAPWTGWLRPRSARIEVPVSTYLITHSEGTVLVDTGWHTDVRTDQRSHLGRFAHSIFRARLPPGMAVQEQLDQRGLSPEDLDLVVLSHLHADHASGLEHVADARKIVVSEPEWAARETMGYISSMWAGIDVEPVALERIGFGPTGRGRDLFGDGSVILVYTPGHSPGHLSILVDSGVGWVLLAGDVGYASRSWEDGILPGVTTNDHEATRSLTWLREFSKREDCIVAVANHDPAVGGGRLRVR